MISRAALWSSLVCRFGAVAALPAQAAPVTVSEIANYAGADRQQMLEDGARREGAILLYATGTQIQPLLDRFMQKYPFIKVAMPRAPSIDVTRKVIEEYSAGLYQVDAYELSSYGLVVPRAQGLLQPFASPELADYDPNTIEPGRNWVSVRESYLGIGYNTQKISRAGRAQVLSGPARSEVEGQDGDLRLALHLGQLGRRHGDLARGRLCQKARAAEHPGL